ncbi:MAG: VIT1/CCC1 transporter family protein [Halocynthiibacter sp.]
MDIAKHRRDVHGITQIQENLRQIVYGGNDGIVTTFAVVAGFAGANADGVVQLGTVAVLIFGFANLFADATSMGLGEFLSSRSEQDVYSRIRNDELHRIEHDRETEHAEIIALLQLNGVSKADAHDLARELEKHPQILADFMMSYEFGMSNPADENPALNALFTFVSFLVFGFIPLTPYVFGLDTENGFIYSSIATGAALTMLGLLRWYATRENLLRSLLETVFIGGVCAVVAFGVGVLLGG